MMIFIAISTCPPSSIPKAQDPSAFTRSTWSLPVNGNFSDLLRGELLQIKEVAKKKRPRDWGDLLMVWLVGSNPLVVSVVGSEPYLFFLFWIFFPEGTKIKNTSQKICRIFLCFQNYENSFCSIVFWMDSFSAWAMGCKLLKKTSLYPGIKGDTQIQQTKGRVQPKPSDVEMILLIGKIW